MRGKGVGRDLIGLFLELARERTHKVWCDTRTSNDTAIRVLRACAFEEMATVPRHWYDQDFIIWQILLR